VGDVGLVLSVLAEEGAELAGPLERDFRGVRVAWFRDLGGVPFEGRVRAVVDGHRKTFEALGCVVEEAEPEFGLAEESFRVLRAWSSAAQHGARLRARPEAYKETLRAEIEEGLRLTGAEVARAEAARAEMGRRFGAFLEKYEYFVLPVTQVAPFAVETEYPEEIEGVKLGGYIEWMKSCWYISATGSPAASVPGGFTEGGLPVGVQIVGRRGADLAVLAMARGFERATGYGRRRPEIVRKQGGDLVI
jgi:amidase